MGVNDYIHVGQKIKKARLSRGLSQKEMAALMELPISTYANYEADRREMSTGLISTAALLLDISLADLMGCQYNGVDPQKMIDEYYLKIALNGRKKLGYGPYTKFSSSSAPEFELTEQEKHIISIYHDLDRVGQEKFTAFGEGLLTAARAKDRRGYYTFTPYENYMVAESGPEYQMWSNKVNDQPMEDADRIAKKEIENVSDTKKMVK